MTPERYRRVKALFQDVVELAPAERRLRLEIETAGDSQLREQVETMLRHSTGAGPLDRPACEGLQIEPRFEAGARLGPYEIVSEAGAGGMGRVYKARDTRLDRTIAIKVLSAEFSHRLRAEARAISALNHPHVCALYDIGEQGGAGYLVMEWVEGETLASRLARGPFPADYVVRYGAQIAEALAAAHSRDIVHRDLKPSNIMVTAEGVKVLDFGVARIAQDAAEVESGMAGTAAYMSPSQWNGNAADARSDIYALGLVLYEMAAGTRYRGSASGLAPQLAGIVERCLREDASTRFQTMGDVKAALEAAPRLPVRRPRSRAAGAALLVTIGVAAVWRLTAPPPMAVLPAPKLLLPSAPPMQAWKATARAPIKEKPKPPMLITLSALPGLQRDASFSPDGGRVAFAWHNKIAGYAICVRDVRPDAAPVQLTSGGDEDWGPAWSPDGTRIAFRRRSSPSEKSGIYWVKAAGGEAVGVAPIGHVAQETLPQIAWSRNGEYIVTPDRNEWGQAQLYLLNVANGERRELTTNVRGTDHAPAFSPDGRSLAYASCASGVNGCDVYVMALSRELTPGRVRQITTERAYIRGVAWLPDGRNIVYSAGPSRAIQPSLYRVNVEKPSKPELIELAGRSARHPSVAGNGLLAFTRLPDWNLMLVKNVAW